MAQSAASVCQHHLASHPANPSCKVLHYSFTSHCRDYSGHLKITLGAVIPLIITSLEENQVPPCPDKQQVSAAPQAFLCSQAVPVKSQRSIICDCHINIHAPCHRQGMGMQFLLGKPVVSSQLLFQAYLLCSLFTGSATQAMDCESSAATAPRFWYLKTYLLSCGFSNHSR